jgi:Rho GTPase-activating protein 1
MKGSSQPSQINLNSWTPSQQFGVTIEWISANHPANIPPVMTMCIDFLSHPDCLETEGIFR